MLFRSIWFCLNFIFAFVATFVAIQIVQFTTGLTAGPSVLVVMPLVVASMIEGQVFGRRYHVRPSSQLCWVASLRMTAMVVLITLSILVPHLLMNSEGLARLDNIDATGRAAAFMLLVVIAWGLLRLGYSIGLASELKGQQFPDK